MPCSTAPFAELAEVADAEPLAHEALVSVDAVSLNRGEVRRLERLEPGTVAGLGADEVLAELAAEGYPTRELFSRAPGAVLHGLYIFDELDHTRTAAADLRRLADLVAAGRVDPQIDLTASWSEAASAIEALLDRRVAGKAVLTLDGGQCPSLR